MKCQSDHCFAFTWLEFVSPGVGVHRDESDLVGTDVGVVVVVGVRKI